jgi:glycerol uptake facilitator-like aquaporin
MRTGSRPAVRRNARNKLAAAAATCALLAAAGMASAGPAGASASPARESGAALRRRCAVTCTGT